MTGCDLCSLLAHRGLSISGASAVQAALASEEARLLALAMRRNFQASRPKYLSLPMAAKCSLCQGNFEADRPLGSAHLELVNVHDRVSAIQEARRELRRQVRPTVFGLPLLCCFPQLLSCGFCTSTVLTWHSGKARSHTQQFPTVYRHGVLSASCPSCRPISLHTAFRPRSLFSPQTCSRVT